MVFYLWVSGTWEHFPQAMKSTVEIRIEAIEARVEAVVKAVVGQDYRSQYRR